MQEDREKQGNVPDTLYGFPQRSSERGGCGSSSSHACTEVRPNSNVCCGGVQVTAFRARALQRALLAASGRYFVDVSTDLWLRPEREGRYVCSGGVPQTICEPGYVQKAFRAKESRDLGLKRATTQRAPGKHGCSEDRNVGRKDLGRIHFGAGSEQSSFCKSGRHYIGASISIGASNGSLPQGMGDRPSQGRRPVQQRHLESSAARRSGEEGGGASSRIRHVPFDCDSGLGAGRRDTGSFEEIVTKAPEAVMPLSEGGLSALF